jgi:hypothetical protein
VVQLRDTVKAVENYFTAVLKVNAYKEKAFRTEIPLTTSKVPESTFDAG